METDTNEAPQVTKPDRPPDFVTHYGSAFWWAELVYQGADGYLAKICVDQNDGSFFILRLRKWDSSFRANLAPAIKQKYDEWLYEVFEKHLAGDVGSE